MSRSTSNPTEPHLIATIERLATRPNIGKIKKSSEGGKIYIVVLLFHKQNLSYKYSHSTFDGVLGFWGFAYGLVSLYEEMC